MTEQNRPQRPSEAANTNAAQREQQASAGQAPAPGQPQPRPDREIPRPVQGVQHVTQHKQPYDPSYAAAVLAQQQAAQQQAGTAGELEGDDLLPAAFAASEINRTATVAFVGGAALAALVVYAATRKAPVVQGAGDGS